MSTDYEAYYKEHGPNALGPPGKFVTDFFRDLDIPNARVLDVGCGQGRDAFHAASLAHAVHGVDNSATGIAQMLEQAKARSLPVTGEVADLATWVPLARYDVVLFDRVLHMLDRVTRTEVFERVLSCLDSGGYAVIVDEAPNMPPLVEIAQSQHLTLVSLRKGNAILHKSFK